MTRAASSPRGAQWPTSSATAPVASPSPSTRRSCPAAPGRPSPSTKATASRSSRPTRVAETSEPGLDPSATGDDKLVIAGESSVSYTHLRAHETDSYLVCRLLLEKKQKTKNISSSPTQHTKKKTQKIHKEKRT